MSRHQQRMGLVISRPVDAIDDRSGSGRISCGSRGRFTSTSIRAGGTSVAPYVMFPSKTIGGQPEMNSEPVRATEEVLRRVQGEFLEMPGLRLTSAQAQRLWGLDAASCSALLGALVDARFLFRTRDGAVMRLEQAMPVKAPL